MVWIRGPAHVVTETCKGINIVGLRTAVFVREEALR
jgi:hypothetical protein